MELEWSLDFTPERVAKLEDYKIAYDKIEDKIYTVANLMKEIIFELNELKNNHKDEDFYVSHHKYLTLVLQKLLLTRGPHTINQIKDTIKLAPQIEEKCIYGALYNQKSIFYFDEKIDRWCANGSYK